jgi:hypothetical protein
VSRVQLCPINPNPNNNIICAHQSWSNQMSIIIFITSVSAMQDRMTSKVWRTLSFHSLLLMKLLLCNAREARPSCVYSIFAYLADCCITMKLQISFVCLFEYTTDWHFHWFSSYSVMQGRHDQAAFIGLLRWIQTHSHSQREHSRIVQHI